jgi:subtilisin-like proprotein convertase family protein
VQHLLISHSSRTKSLKRYRIASFLLTSALLTLIVGSFTTVSGQDQSSPIFIGDIQYQTPSQSALPLPEAAPVYTDQWAVQVAPGTDLNALSRSIGMENLGQIGHLEDSYLLRATGTTGRSTNLTARLRAIPGVIWAEQQVLRQHYPRVPSDPLVGNQWHLNNTGQSGTAGSDANVFAAWDAGFTGTGVQIAIVDDGLQIAHPDIAPNYFAAGSYDFNSNEADPTGASYDAHGTSAGGVAAAADDGTECGVGAAYNAQLAGIRLIAGGVTDATEATALSYAYQQNDVYNNSWGPYDDGSVLEGPGTALQAAFADAVTNGRGGLGSIYVWAGGNGHDAGDHANADGYANSRFVIAVAASTNQGVQSYYSEVGANIMVNAPSSGTGGITTTDLTGGNGYSGTNCTSSFGGTSSASPLVAGVVGLMLEANPTLTWRDVMHVLINSAEKNDPSGTYIRTWETNGAGHDINYAYGFGRVDAGAAVAMANTWTNVPANVTPFTSGVITVNQPIPDGTSEVVISTVNVPDNFVVEHVEVVLNISHTSRGQVVAAVQSPDGTSSTLLFPRPDSGDNYNNWKTSSLRHWGEESSGTWTLSVADMSAGTTGTLNSWQLILHGYSEEVETPTPETPTPETPTPETPTPETPTPETPTPETPTPTELPDGTVELIANGGFEALNGEGKPVLAPWEVKNPTGDKVKCNKDGKPPVSNSGECAFRFKGSLNEAGKLQQTLDLTGLNLQQGDALDVQWAMNVPAGSTGKVKLVVKYSDGADATKFKEAFVQTTGYETWGTAVGSPLLIASPNVEKIKFSIGNKSEADKLYVDDISVMYTPASEDILGLPSFSTTDSTGFGRR